MKPWYKGFQGEIKEIPGIGFLFSGLYEMLDDNTLEITELPFQIQTRDYKNYLEELAGKDEVDEIREYHMENRVHFSLTVPRLKELEAKNDIEKKFKLQSTFSSANYVLFTHEGKIKRYSDEVHILKEFFPLRGDLYTDRKEFMLAKLQKEYEILFNKVQFIQAIISETLKINKVKRVIILQRV